MQRKFNFGTISITIQHDLELGPELPRSEWLDEQAVLEFV